MFLQVSVCPQWGGGACMVAQGGCAWLLRGACLGGCVVKGACMVKRGCAWQRGACMVKGGVHGERGACMAKGGRAWYEIRPVIARAVRILLECILVRC